MAFLRNVSNDVFISYRYQDNEEDVWGNKPVKDFYRFLDREVRQRIGEERVKIYFSELDAQPNRDFEMLMAEVRSSAIFVAVASPSYTRAGWALEELAEFEDSGRPSDCIFVVELRPLPEGIRFPSSIETKTRLRFWTTGPESRAAIPLSPRQDPPRYTELISDLAGRISARLLALEQADGCELKEQASGPSRHRRRPAGPKSAAEFGSITGTVLVAQSTDDLVEQRDQVCSYLRQAGLTVLPSSEYPQGGEAFKTAIADDLKCSDLFVQLLGLVPGRKPPDLPEGFTRHQFEAAKAAGVPILQWRHPELKPELVGDDSHRSLLTDSVNATGLESFKSEIVHKLTKTSAPSKQTEQRIVYIDADRVDLPVAESIRDALRSNHAVALPVFDSGGLVDLDENLKECDAVIFVYGKASVKWVRAHLLRFLRTRADRVREANPVVLYSVPPPDKLEVALDFPNLRLIRCDNSIDLAPLLALFER